MKSLLLRLFAAFLFLFQPALAGPTFETQWKFIPVQDGSGNWWDSIEVQTVPGVMYRLERSNDLSVGSWSTLATRYGMGEAWVCPVIRRTSPPSPENVPENGYTLPAPEADPVRQVAMWLGKSPSGEMALSWLSLDDQTHKTKLLAVPPAPVWEDFDGFYLQQHGNFFFALSAPFMETDAGTSASFGPLDQQMLEVFEGALDDIAENIEDQVTAAAAYAPPVSSTAEREFYRVVADWGYSSTGSCRYDWQKWVLDETDPFAPDDGTGGDGGGSGGSSGGYPVPGGVAPVQPLARIQQQSFLFIGFKPSQGTVFIPEELNIEAGSATYQALDDAAKVSFDAFKGAVDGLALPNGDGDWRDTLSNFNYTKLVYEVDWLGVPPYTALRHECTRTRFRLKLDAPAPEGGYSIPLRVGIVRQNVASNPLGHLASIAPAVLGETRYIDVTLTCPAGAMTGPAVEFQPLLNMAENQTCTYVPASVSTREPDLVIEGGYTIPAGMPDDGSCVAINEATMVNFGNHQAKQWLLPYGGSPLRVEWRSKRLQGNGTFDVWSTLRSPVFNVPYEGVHVGIPAHSAGIFQLQAVLLLPNGAEIEYPFVRMRHARSIRNSEGTDNSILKAGQPDYFGVANSVSLALRDKAVEWLGSTSYRKNVNVPMLPGDPLNPNLGGNSSDPDSGVSKCNVFVTHLANQVGATTPYFFRKPVRWRFQSPFPVPAAPIAKDDWYIEPEKNIDLDGPGWVFRGMTPNPSPGMAISSPGAGADASTSGHLGIMDYDGSWINAGKLNVNKSLHLLDVSQDYKPNNFRSR